MAFHSEWLRSNSKGPRGPIPPKGAEGALGPLGPLGPLGALGTLWVPRSLGPRRCALANLKKQGTT